MMNYNTAETARAIEEFFHGQVELLRSAGVEAHTSIMPGEFQTSIGLEVFGAREDAEFAIDLLLSETGVEVDGALIAGSGRTLGSYGPVMTSTKASLRKEALRLAAIGSQALMERFALSPAR